MASLVFGINITLFLLFMLLYSYQFYYLFIGFRDKLKHPPLPEAKINHRLAVIICARNEERVIGHLIDSINRQDYPVDCRRVVVIADNCTDGTAEVARSHGATVYERFNHQYIGKSYALQFGFDKIFADPSIADEAYVFIDADNLLDRRYLSEMNRMFDMGYVALTSYRNSKNYGVNWITSGYSLWFLREAEYLNRPRALLGNSAAISGTGFLISADLLRQREGWTFHLLTEDIECTVATILEGQKIGYARDAILYDEQPVTFHDSYKQRKRWAKGFYQVIWHYGKSLLANSANVHRKPNNRFSSYDMVMTIMPALFITLAGIIFNLIMLIYGVVSLPENGDPYLIYQTSQAIIMSFTFFYLTLFGIGGLALYTEWRRIDATKKEKILSLFTFPLFMFTYIPIAVAALFMKVEWEPIVHHTNKSIDEIGI